MAVTSSSMIVRFPSLSTAPTPLLNACITAAQLRVTEAVWGTLVDEGVLHLAAHLATIDPAGIKARKADKSGMSVYKVEYDRLVGIVSSGFRVTGDTSTIVI